MKFLLAFCVLLALAACAPPLAKPDLSMGATAYLPPDAVAAQSPDIVVSPTALPRDWWESFGNAGLNSLIVKALEASPTIAAADANLAAARADGEVANGAYLPQIGVNPSLSRQSYPTGPNGFPPYTIYSITGTISYDPGLFGARQSSFRNGVAQVAYQQAEQETARQTLVGNIVAAAIGEAGYQAQIAVTQQIISSEQHLLNLLNGEYADGAIPELNLLQQQSAVLATQATLPPLQTQVDDARDRLAILSGTLPAAFVDPQLSIDAFMLPATIPVALPSAYLAHRPDIVAARATVAAQNAALGLAIAHLYPDLTLSASGGYAAETISTLFEPGAALWTLAGNLLAPLYDGGVLHGRRQAAQAQLAAALADYRGAVLNAFGEAADSLQAIQNDQLAYQRAQDANRTAAQASSLASQQFALGAIDYTTVLTAQTAATQQALVLVQARTSLLLDIARLQMVMAE